MRHGALIFDGGTTTAALREVAFTLSEKSICHFFYRQKMILLSGSNNIDLGNPVFMRGASIFA